MFCSKDKRDARYSLQLTMHNLNRHVEAFVEEQRHLTFPVLIVSAKFKSSVLPFSEALAIETMQDVAVERCLC